MHIMPDANHVIYSSLLMLYACRVELKIGTTRTSLDVLVYQFLCVCVLIIIFLSVPITLYQSQSVCSDILDWAEKLRGQRSDILTDE
jgi:hypothetical protein